MDRISKRIDNGDCSEPCRERRDRIDSSGWEEQQCVQYAEDRPRYQRIILSVVKNPNGQQLNKIRFHRVWSGCQGIRLSQHGVTEFGFVVIISEYFFLVPTVTR